jgi:hypothetical protein
VQVSMPGASCTAPGCSNSSWRKGKTGDNFKFRMVRYPKDRKRRKEWLEAIGRPDWEPYEEARLCEVSTSLLM